MRGDPLVELHDQGPMLYNFCLLSLYGKTNILCYKTKLLWQLPWNGGKYPSNIKYHGNFTW